MWKDEIKRLSYTVAHFSMEGKKHVETFTLVIDLDVLFPIVESLLNQQRENCANVACVVMPSHPHLHGTKNINYNEILNAPEPGVK